MKLLLWLGIASWFAAMAAAGPACAEEFRVGVYGDETRSVDCFVGAAGDTFMMFAWAWVPEARGTAYVTLRFDFPSNIEFPALPVFNPLAGEVIVTDFADGTVEWNILFAGCPSGWVRIFQQECVLRNFEPSLIRIVAGRSMVRDCGFILNDVLVAGEMALNDPLCGGVPEWRSSWGGLKVLYR